MKKRILSALAVMPFFLLSLSGISSQESLSEAETITVPANVLGNTEDAEYTATDVEPAERKKVYEPSTEEKLSDIEPIDLPLLEGEEKSQTTSSKSGPITTTRITTETITTKTVTTVTKESSTTETTEGGENLVSEPAKAEPAKTEVVKEEPVKTEPVKTEPVKVEPAKTEAAKTEPVKAEPVKTQAAKTEPAKTEPAKTEPAKTEPVKAEPVKTEPAKTEASKTEASDAPVTNEDENSQISEKEVRESRSVTIKRGQYLDITYPGRGWIYLGEKEGGELLRYFGRKIGIDDTTFTLRGKDAGTDLLHFYKNDALSGTYIDDYLKVTVLEEEDNDAHITAPAYGDYVPQPTSVSGGKKPTSVVKEEEKKSEEKKVEEKKESSKSEEVSATQAEASTEMANAVLNSEGVTGVSSSGVSQDDLLKQAQESYDNKDFAKCLSTLEEFFAVSDESKVDQGLYLKGRALEAPSSSRNIKTSLETYQTLISRYPQSSLWNNANERITYIQRMYFDIR